MENFEAQQQRGQDQTEQVEQENGLENTWNNIAELKNNYEESKRRLNENWEKESREELNQQLNTFETVYNGIESIYIDAIRVM